MSVITANQFKNKATRIIEITGFDKDEKISVRIRPVSILTMLTKGKLPNTLLTVVTEMFNKTNTKEDTQEQAKDMMMDLDNIKNMTELMDCVCRECLVEPAYEEISEYLTDVQKTEIFTASQSTIEKVTPITKE